jgi:hypothetical protein
MNKIILTSISIIFACNSILGQTTDEKYSEDVQSVDAIIKAYYDVVILGNLSEIHICILKMLI